MARYGSAGPRTEGTVMTVTFELDGQQFLALNGGPNFTFSEVVHPVEPDPAPLDYNVPRVRQS